MTGVPTVSAWKQAGLDVGVTILVAVFVNLQLHSVTPAYSGPLTAVVVLITTSVLLRFRGQRWRDLGLILRHGPFVLAGLVLAVMVGTILAGGITGAVCSSLLESPSGADAPRFGEVEGNLPKFLLLVAMGWAVGGFIEEMVFRGYLFHRIETILAACTERRWFVVTLAIFLQAALFGVVHYYNRGLASGITITVVGIALGTFYLVAKRSLWPTILAHGMVDTLGFLEGYFGV